MVTRPNPDRSAPGAHPASPSSPPLRPHQPRPYLLLVSGITILGLIGLLASYSNRRYLDPDELEHLNAAYFISQGETIYGSFFENHPPLTAIMLQPIVRLCETPAAMITWARRLMLALSAATLLTTALLGSTVLGRQCSLLAVIWLLAHQFFIEKTIEVRPDVPAQLCMVLALATLAGPLSRFSPWCHLAAGILLATAALFTPKVVFAASGAVIGIGLASAGARQKGRLKAALRSLVLLAAGGAVPAAIAAAVMAWHGVLAGFISDVLITSTRMTVDDPAGFRWYFLKTTLSVNAVAWMAALIGTIVLFRKRHQFPSGFVEAIIGSLIGGIVGLFVIQAPMRQYYLTFLAPSAIAGAVAIVTTVDRVLQSRWTIWAPVIFLCILVAQIIPPVLALRSVRPTFDAQIKAINQVVKGTSPEDRVLDCWTGLYLTRLPAYRYFYLNSDVQRLLPSRKLEQDLLAALGDPRVKMVIWDQYFTVLPHPVIEQTRAQFSPLPNFPYLWLRHGRSSIRQSSI
jgi:hypothetical protein